MRLHEYISLKIGSSSRVNYGYLNKQTVYLTPIDHSSRD